MYGMEIANRVYFCNIKPVHPMCCAHAGLISGKAHALSHFTEVSGSVFCSSDKICSVQCHYSNMAGGLIVFVWECSGTDSKEKVVQSTPAREVVIGLFDSLPRCSECFFALIFALRKEFLQLNFQTLTHCTPRVRTRQTGSC